MTSCFEQIINLQLLSDYPPHLSLAVFTAPPLMSTIFCYEHCLVISHKNLDPQKQQTII